MITKKMVKLFENYVNEYNVNPDSEQSDLTYEKLNDKIWDSFDPEMAEKIIDTFCRVKNDNKIDYVENLSVLDSYILPVDYKF